VERLEIPTPSCYIVPVYIYKNKTDKHDLKHFAIKVCSSRGPYQYNFKRSIKHIRIEWFRKLSAVIFVTIVLLHFQYILNTPIFLYLENFNKAFLHKLTIKHCVFKIVTLIGIACWNGNKHYLC